MERSTANIKKLIADSDFGDLDELSKRWQRPGETSRLTEEPDLKQNLDTSNRESEIPTKQQKQVAKTKTDTLIQTDYKRVLEKEKKPHNMQFIDEDTEHFKVRLQHLLNVFKTDAVSEFMSMKRTLLEEQKDQVKADTEKYLRLYEQKHQELIQTRQALNQKSRECESLTITCERMAKSIYSQKIKTQTIKCLAVPFTQLLKYKQYKVLKRKKEAAAITFRLKMLVRKGLIAWRLNNSACRKQKDQKRLELQLNDVTDRYQKETQMLREKFGEAAAKLDDHERNKNLLQDNLKKAFMRGVCAMNFQAMSALNGQGIQMTNPLLPQDNSFSDKSLSEQIPIRINESLVKTQISFGGPVNSSPAPQFGTKSVVFYKHTKIQSKDHNWKDAPVLNFPNKQVREQIEDLQPINIAPDRSCEEEGRVIKVVNGKSSVVTQMAQNPPQTTKKAPSSFPVPAKKKP